MIPSSGMMHCDLSALNKKNSKRSVSEKVKIAVMFEHIPIV